MTGAVGFYATIVRDSNSARRVGFLLGPYPDEPAARAQIATARRLAEAVDPFTAFDAFGTARLEVAGELPRGVLMVALDKELME